MNVPMRLLIFGWLCFFLASSITPNFGQTPETDKNQKATTANEEVLQPGRRLTVSGKVKQSEFRFFAPKGAYIQFLVDQKGVDVVLRVLDEHNNIVCWIDRPNGSWGPEHLGFIATTEEMLRLIIRSGEVSVPQPEYSVLMYVPRKPMAADETA